MSIQVVFHWTECGLQAGLAFFDPTISRFFPQKNLENREDHSNNIDSLLF